MQSRSEIKEEVLNSTLDRSADTALVAGKYNYLSNCAVGNVEMEYLEESAPRDGDQLFQTMVITCGGEHD